MLSTEFDKLPVSNETSFNFLPFFVCTATYFVQASNMWSYKMAKLPVTKIEQTSKLLLNLAILILQEFLFLSLVNDKALLGLIICAWTLFAWPSCQKSLSLFASHMIDLVSAKSLASPKVFLTKSYDWLFLWNIILDLGWVGISWSSWSSCTLITIFSRI